MKPDDLNWPVVYSGGAAVFFGPTGGFGRAYFGGPLDQRFEPPPDGPAPLQRIFTFDVGELPKPEGRILEGNLSLFFGMQYNGCVLSYRMPVLRYKLRGANAIAARIQDAQALEIVELHPSSSSDGWPYIGYPQLLPYIPLTEIHREPMAVTDFESQCTWQGVDGLRQQEMVVVIPACANLGISLWGRDGDEEAVQIVYRFDCETGIVQGTACCT